MALPWEVARANRKSIPAGIKKLKEQQASDKTSQSLAPATNYIQAQMQPAIAAANSRELLPYASNAADSGNGLGILTGGVADILSAPGRFIDSAISGGGLQNFKKNMSDVKTDRGILRNIVRAPETPVNFVPVGGAGAGLGSVMLRSALVGAGAGTVGEMGNYAQTGEFSPGTIALDAGIGAAVPPALKFASKLVKKAAPYLKNTLFHTSGVPVEALEKASTPQGLEQLRKTAGKELPIAKDLLETVQKIAKGDEQKAVVEGALNGMGPISVEETVNALKGAMYSQGSKPLPKYKEAINDAIQQQINDLTTVLNDKGEVIGKSVTRELPAKEFFEARKDFDKLIPYDNDPYGISGKLYQRLSPGREAMKNALINQAENSGVPEYAQAMKEWSDNITAAKQLLDGVGGGLLESNPESFGRNIFGAAKTETQQNIRRIEKITGKDFLEQLKNAQLAKQLLDENGIVPIISKHNQGKSLFGSSVGSSAGAGLGALLAGPTGAAVGGSVGGLLGTALTGPRGAIALNKAINASKPALNAVSKKLASPKTAKNLSLVLRNIQLNNQNQTQSGGR